jgi:hypothetical protein
VRPQGDRETAVLTWGASMVGWPYVCGMACKRQLFGTSFDCICGFSLKSLKSCAATVLSPFCCRPALCILTTLDTSLAVRPY